MIGINTSNALNALIYQKALRFPLIRSADHSLGSLVNHIQVDSEELAAVGDTLGDVLVLPFSIAVGLYLMYTAVGIAFLSALGVLLLMSLINYFFGKAYLKYVIRIY